MYIKPKKENKKRNKIIIVVAAAVILGLILVFVIIQIVQANQKSNVDTVKTDNTTTTTSQQTGSNTQNTTNETTDPKEVKQYEGEDPNTKNELTGSITSAFLANGKFSLRVNIDQYISSGTCTLTMTKGSQTYATTAPLIPNASSSTCQGFDAAESEVGSGTWHVKINLEGNNKTGIIESEVHL